MKTTKGLFTDTIPNDTPPGYMTFAKNILLTEKLGIIQNEPGFEFIANLPYQPIGLLPVQNRIVVWGTNNSFSEIGVFNNLTNTYTKVINDTDIGTTFGFNTTYPIQAEFHINVKNELIVAWIDDINTPKIVNIDTPSFQPNDLELFPAASLAIPTVSINQSGGSVKTGVYRILYYFEDDDGTTSNYSAPSKPVSIIKALDSALVNTVWGNGPGETTSKSVTFSIAVDTNWSFVNIVVLKTINGVTSAIQIKRLSTSSANFFGQLTGAYTGDEPEVVLTLEEILTPKAVYKTARAITQLNNKLYLGNLTTEDEIVVQKIAMNARIDWRANLISSSVEFGSLSNYKEKSGTNFAGFQHGEVYGFYLQVRDKQTGLWSKGFHIPGRAYAAGDDAITSPSPSGSYVSGTGSPTFKKYQLEDTCQLIASPSSTEKTGRMGYWANTNELYPTDDEYNGALDYSGNPIVGGRDLRGQPVLHHKFPTLSFMRTNAYSAFTNYGTGSFMDVLSIDVLNVNIPVNLQSKISSWRICYAKRDYNSATVLGVSPIFFYARGEFTNQLKPTPGNFGVNQTGTGTDDMYMRSDTDLNSTGSEFIRFHDFGLLIEKPSIAPTYLRQEIRLGNTAGTNPAILTDPRLITDNSGAGAFRKWAYYSVNNNLTATTVPFANRFRNVTFIQYLPNGGIVSSSGKTINNVAGEDCLLLRNNISGITNNNSKFLNLVGPSDPFMWNNSWVHATHLSSLCVVRSDVYSSFIDQDLVAIPNEVLNPATSFKFKLYGGDTWVGYNSIHLQGPVADDKPTATVPGGNLLGEGTKGVHYILTESTKNLNYRYQDPADIQSSFYDATDLFPKIVDANYTTRYLGLMDLFKTPVYLYNNDYNTKSEFGLNLTPFDPFTITETSFPTTIASSLTQSNETTTVNWKNFLIEDRYTMPRNKGSLVHLQAVGNQRLYIHHENTLYVTKDRTTLKGDIADVTLGSGDIFAVTPFEVLSSDQGYGGTQHRFACVLTKIGYVFPDAAQGKIFIHNGEQLEEVSKNGLRQFWRDNLNSDLPDNPFNNRGMTIAFDEKYNRLLFGIKDTTTGKVITASYSPQLQAWASYHDYDPSYMYSTWTNKTYSIRTDAGVSKVYLHNTGEYGKYYQEDTSRYALIADIVFNANPYETKHVSAVTWLSQVFNGTETPLETQTITSLTLRSNTRTTGKIPITNFTALGNIYSSNSRLTENSWAFNEIRDIAISPPATGLVLDFANNYNINPAAIDVGKEWYNKARFIDNYAIVRFEFDNLSNNKFYLLDHDVVYRKSYRA